MASDGIDIRLGVDPSGAVEGIEDVNDALKKIDDNLGDVAKSGDDDLGKIEKSLKDLNKEALKTGDELDKSIGKKTKKAAEEGKSGMDDFKQEANQTARESAASFDGSAESIVDVFQEVAANAFQGFGPAGAVAGLAIAAGIGLGVKAFEDGQASAEELKERIGELAGALIESGGDLNLDYVVDTLKALATGSGAGSRSLSDLKKIADNAGLSFGDLSKAVANNLDNYDELIQRATDYTYELAEQTRATDNFDAVTLDNIASKQAATAEYIAVLEDAKAVAEGAALAEQAAAEAGISELEVKRDVQEQVNAAYDEAAGNVDAYINAETGLFDTAAYITAMQEREKALNGYQEALATSGLDENAKAFLASQGAEAAAIQLKGYTSADAATKAELSRIWSEAAKEASGDASKEIDAGLPKEKEVKVTADTSAANETIKNWKPDQKTIDVLVRWKDARTGQVIQ
jgi:hypothetical protein